MSARELIRKKRDGEALSPSEIHSFILSYVNGEIPDYQVAAWLMAVFFRGMSGEETLELTRAMLHSGTKLRRPDPSKEYWLDKHSTGGIGDKTSLLLVPIVTAVAEECGLSLRIPMISGRALGHSGGTLDKLESVPGFSSSLKLEKAEKLLQKNGFFMMGQTEELVPADRKIYSLRDAISTVECIPLIVSSIMSKKLSESLDGLVFDVKCGGGAFMKTRDEARKLARALVETAKHCGVECVALISTMNEPLGYKVGNFLEVEECADFLSKGIQDEGLAVVTYTLASRMIELASRGRFGRKESEERAREVVDSKLAYRIFVRMFEAQGGNWSAFEEERERVPGDLAVFEYKSTFSGFLAGVDSLAVGRLVERLGTARATTSSTIDLRVGVELIHKVGDRLSEGDAIARVYHRTNISSQEISGLLEGVFAIESFPTTKTVWVLEEVA